ncbi:hypothetical protein ACTHOQ_16690 [Solibacillus silvestris]|uniref:hypothetical protein n=1 Tax=Solibacillus silvestris TaxID=76853 RepID=UPI003F7FC118
MISLLKMHFYLSRKLLLLSFTLILGLMAAQWFISNQINIGFLSIYLLCMTPALNISFLLENHFIKRLRIIPIAPKNFVKSLFIFCLLLASCISVPLAIYQAVLYKNGQIGHYEFSFIAMVFAAGIASIGSMLKSYLSNPSQAKKSFSIWPIITYIFVFTIVHFAIQLLFNIMDMKLAGAAVTPLVGLYVYYKYYKAAVIGFKAAEF